MYVSDWAA